MENNKDEALRLEVKFKFKDVLRFNLSVAKKNMINDIAMLVGAFVLVLFFYKMMTSNEPIDIYISNNIFLLLVPLLVFILIPWRIWKLTMAQMQVPAFAEGVTYIFSNDGITLQTNEGKDEVKWEVFKSIVETKKDFRLYVNKVSAQIIPKHNLNEEQILKLKELIKNSAQTGTFSLR